MTFVACIFIIVFGSIRDGISDRAPGVGWTNWHIVTWLARVLAVFVLLLKLAYAGYWLQVFTILIVSTFHNFFYKIGLSLRPRLQGPGEKPEWFKAIEKIWSWLPWV